VAADRELELEVRRQDQLLPDIETQNIIVLSLLLVLGRFSLSLSFRLYPCISLSVCLSVCISMYLYLSFFISLYLTLSISPLSFE
jgi:hypothetical protein